MTNHCRALKGKESLKNVNEKEGRNGNDNFVRDKRVSFKKPACMQSRSAQRLSKEVHSCVRGFLAVT